MALPSSSSVLSSLPPILSHHPSLPSTSISPSSTSSSAADDHPPMPLASAPSASFNSSAPFFLRAVHSLYRRWAHFIVRHSWAVIAFCTALTALCTAKVITTPQQNDITGYTPYGARSRQELAIREHFFDAQGLGPPFGIFLLLVPLRTGDQFLRAEMLAEAARVDDAVRTLFPLHNRLTNRTETFKEFCKDFCEFNEPLRHFEEGFRVQSQLRASGEPLNPALQLQYPISSIFGRKFNIQPNFFGITFHENASSANDLSNMARVSMVALTYKAERIGAWTDDEVKAWEMGVSRFFEREFRSALIRVMTVSTTYVEVEVVRAGLSMLPFLLVGFTIMAVCSSVSVSLSALYWHQWNVRKVALAFMACICPFMACGTALGMLFIGGLRFGSVLCVTPFLVLAIGVDDAYLMIHAWQRITSRICGERRNGKVLMDTGPAILISALTNICADAVGSFTGSPEITLLCVGNMAAIAVDFLYQVTFYAAVMALVGRAEMRAEAGEQFRVRIPVGRTEPGPGRAKSRREKLGLHPSVNQFLHSLTDHFVRFVSHPIIASLLFLIWIIFLVISAIFEVNLSTKKLFAADSPLLEIDHYREEQIVPFFQMATVFINSPTNLSDPHRMDQLSALVAAMESIPGSWGQQSTNYFVREFEQFIGEEGDQNADDELDPREKLEQFLDWPENRFWKAFLRFSPNGTTDGVVLDSFFFTTGYHGQQLRKWSERTHLLLAWRAVVDRFPHLNASVFHDEAIFLDLIDNMPTDAWQAALTTLLCMIAVCAIFMGRDLRTVGVAGTIIASIIVGTLGTLSWLGTSMDPIMMAALIISIGFSVDIPAHVSYHFHSSAFLPSGGSALDPVVDPPSSAVTDRLRATLASVGLPALQASLSTSLCVLSLLFVPLYMARVFVLIMCTTIFLCLCHSLLLLPALFALIEYAKRSLIGQKQK